MQMTTLTVARIDSYLKPQEGVPNAVSRLAEVLRNLPIDVYQAVSKLYTGRNIIRFTSAKASELLKKASQRIRSKEASSQLPTSQAENLNAQVAGGLKEMMDEPTTNSKACSTASSNSVQKKFFNHLKNQDSSKYGSVGSLNNVREVLRSNARERANAEAMRQYELLINQFINAQSPTNNERNEMSRTLGSGNQSRKRQLGSNQPPTGNNPSESVRTRSRKRPRD